MIQLKREKIIALQATRGNLRNSSPFIVFIFKNKTPEKYSETLFFHESSCDHHMLDVAFAVLGIIVVVSFAHAGLGATLSIMSLLFCPPFIVGGALLAYYVPTIPFLIWTAALIGWFIVVIESLVAAHPSSFFLFDYFPA